MVKWEYCEAQISIKIGKALEDRPTNYVIFRRGGKHVRGDGKCGDVLAALGDEGWELVGSSARISTGIGGRHAINYIFKRPAE